MSEREIFCGKRPVAVKRLLRPDIDIVAGGMLPFMVAAEEAEFVRAHEDEPFVLRDGDDSWAIEILSVEKTGKEGVWVGARVVGKVSKKAIHPAPMPSRRGTLMGGPLAGLTEESEELPAGDAGTTAPMGRLPLAKKRDD